MKDGGACTSPLKNCKACLSCTVLFCRNISAVQFRNYTVKEFSFLKKVTGIYGANGSGKTNLLDALYYLCFTKSYFATAESQNVKKGTAGMRLKGIFTREQEELSVTAIIRETGRKEFLWNELAYSRFSEHIGKIPCVMIAPDDVSLITGSSEERRRFIDTILSQLQPAYLQQLIDYNKILQQRNSFLKTAADSNQLDNALLSVLNTQLAEKGQYIYKERKLFLEQLLPLVNEQYRLIAGETDTVQLAYKSQLLEQQLISLLGQNLQKDLALQRTSAGIHKDDLVITMQDTEFRYFASQGQRKTLLFALKLAEFFLLKKAKGFSPILLLDDVFEKLDENRMHNLLSAVCSSGDTQVLITDTHKERLQKAFETMSVDFELIDIQGELP